MSKFKSAARSAAREKLQECISARSEVDQRLAELQAAVAKLDSQIADVAPAEAALAKLNEADDHAALRWATGAGARPQPDAEAHDRLARELSAARASAASASRAKDTLMAQMTQEAAKVGDIARYADAAIVEILTETAGPLVDELRVDAIALAAKIKSLEVVSGMALQIAEKGRHVPAVSAADHALANLGVKGFATHNVEPANPTPPEALRAATALLEKFSIRLWAPVANGIVGATESFPQVLERHTAAASAWRAFEADLHADSSVRFSEVA
jgi:hypothetical protein